MCSPCLCRNFYLYLAVFTAHTGSFIAGTCMTWPSAVLPKLIKLDDNPLGRSITATEMGVLGSIPIIGALAGIFCSGYLAKMLGRRPVLILLGVPSVVGNFMMISSTNMWALYSGRLITGITIGAILTVDTMYFAEVAENSNRGLLGTAMISFINAGLLFVLIVGPWTSYFMLHIILGVLPIIYIICVYLFVPESPYFLIEKDYEKAQTSLKKLRGVADVKMELDYIKQSLEKEKKIRLSHVLHNKGLRKGLLIGSGLIMFQQFSGNNVISSYCQLILEEVVGGVPSEIGPVIIIGIQSVVCLITPLFIDKCGRKLFLLISHIGMAVTQVMFGVYFFMKDDGQNVSALSWLPLVSLVLCNVSYAFGSGPIPWAVIGELFPSEVKEVSTSIVALVNMCCNFIMMFTFNFVVESIGMGPTFCIFSFLGLLASIFVRFYVIETKGRSLVEIQTLLNA